MGNDVYGGSEAGKAFFERADSVLGFSLSRLILEGSADELRQTENAQSTIFCTSIAYLKAVEERMGGRLPDTPLWLPLEHFPSMQGCVWSGGEVS